MSTTTFPYLSEAFVRFTGDCAEDIWSMCLLSCAIPEKVPILPSVLPLTFCSQCLDMVRGLDSLISGPEILKQVGRHMLPKDCTSKILEETVYDSILYTSLLKHNGLTTCLCRGEYPFWFCFCEHACVPVQGFVHMNAWAHRGQNRVLHSLGLKLQANESYTLWVLRI